MANEEPDGRPQTSLEKRNFPTLSSRLLALRKARP